LTSASAEETLNIAEAFGSICRPNDVIGLEGTLGAGKTQFVKGLARGLGVPEKQRVTSPTFVLLNKYEGRLPIYHFDAYRLADSTDMEEIGCEEVFSSGGVSVVEWADHVVECFPDNCLWTRITITGLNTRAFSIRSESVSSQERIDELRDALKDFSNTREPTDGEQS
jgi:tRNA threonylcarbamoyladenosine biosynthesis protein TsaE